MPNKKTVSLSNNDYDRLIALIRAGGQHFRPNQRIADALVIERNLGIRISDVLNLRLCDIIRDGNRYRLNIREIKTGKERVFTVPDALYTFLQGICISNGIKPAEKLFQIGERAVQKILKLAADELGISGVGTHSMRKSFATEIYEDSGCNVRLVQTLLQHSSLQTTERYLTVSSGEVENALRNHCRIR